MARSELVMALLVAVLAAGCCASAGAVAYLSKLPVTLDVTASPSPGQVLHAGEDVITVTWALNATGPAGDAAAYKSVKVSLCYAPASQKEREWRKTHDDLKKDKTCQFKRCTERRIMSQHVFVPWFHLRKMKHNQMGLYKELAILLSPFGVS
ncbi:unnamed protein product [Triticum turgidum subsp. durum]|uniref:Purple acid phosphatase n=1 Tax=Triticum turgidum subsp. durum TaxID=4567 RepID=A0A9R0W3T8_TRITD|nr:unnamed protein product [Triticum turgidum subsp. durum]